MFCLIRLTNIVTSNSLCSLLKMFLYTFVHLIFLLSVMAVTKIVVSLQMCSPNLYAVHLNSEKTIVSLQMCSPNRYAVHLYCEPCIRNNPARLFVYVIKIVRLCDL